MPTPCFAKPIVPPAFDWTHRPGALARQWPSEALIALVCRAIPANERSVLLAVDVGCGNGRNAIALAKLGFARVIGVEPRESLRDEAKRAATQSGVHLTVHAGEAARLSVDSESADVVTCWGLLFALGGRTATRIALREAWRILRPGGVLIADWRTDADALRPGAKQVGEDAFELPADAPSGLGGVIYSFWTQAEVTTLLQDSGFALRALLRSETRDCLANRSYSWWQTCAMR